MQDLLPAGPASESEIKREVHLGTNLRRFLTDKLPFQVLLASMKLKSQAVLHHVA